jgi:hypothetical protein
VAQAPQKDPKQQHNQPYNASLKGWITQQARAFLPILLPGIHYERTLNVEPVRPPMRVDRVFKVRYDEEDYLLHLEFEVGYDMIETQWRSSLSGCKFFWTERRP